MSFYTIHLYLFTLSSLKEEEKEKRNKLVIIVYVTSKQLFPILGNFTLDQCPRIAKSCLLSSIPFFFLQPAPINSQLSV